MNAMTETQNANFFKLLAAWRRHDDAHRQDGTISDLADARLSLDRARVTTWAGLR